MEQVVYFIALASSVIITITAFILYKTNYGSIYKSEFILQFRYNKFDENAPPYLNILKKFCSSHVLLNSEPSGDNDSLKLTYDIVLKEEMDVNKFIMEISKINNVAEPSIVAAQNDMIINNFYQSKCFFLSTPFEFNFNFNKINFLSYVVGFSFKISRILHLIFLIVLWQLNNFHNLFYFFINVALSICLFFNTYISEISTR